MPVAVIAVSMLVMLMVTTPSAASPSCMSKSEARQHFGPVHIYWHGQDHCWDATPTRRYHQIHQVQRTTDQPKWQDSMSEMLPDEAPVRTPWVAPQADVEPPQLSMAERWVDIVQAAPPRIIRKPKPLVTPRGMVMVIITIILTITIFELLFGGIRWAGRPILARLRKHDAHP